LLSAAPLLFGLAVAEAKRIAKPLHEVAVAAKIVGEGDFSHTVDVRSRDEIGVLGDAFNKMARSIQSLMEEKEKMSAELFHASRLASIGTLAAGVAHEVNNPLAVIMGYAELAQGMLKEDPPQLDSVATALGKQLSAGTRITAIVRQLRSLSRTDPRSERSIDVHEAIQSSVDLLNVIYRPEGVEIRTALNSATPFALGSDGSFQQVIINLLSNAKDSLEGGTGDKTITVETTDRDGKIEVRIVDHGTGIPPEVVDRIFDPFFSTKPAGKGTGLGLSISHSIVSNMHGRLSVVSEVGKGTVFTIRLPHAPARQSAASHTTPAPALDTKRSPRLTGRVLIVDDEPDVRHVLSRHIGALGLDPVEAEDGDVALEKVKAEHFDCVLLDLKMPRISGRTVIEEARRAGKTDVKWVILTGAVEADRDPRTRAVVGRYADAVLYKPVDRQTITAVLRGMCPRAA
jgi:signal transduction histidine kinase/CheY-like chemotaxis protein